MAESAKIVSRAEQRFDPQEDRVITVLYGLTNTGEVGVLDTVVITVEAFVRCFEMQKRTMEQMQRLSAQKYVETMPKGRRRKAPSNVLAMKR
jgi:hypothetical protein